MHPNAEILQLKWEQVTFLGVILAIVAILIAACGALFVAWLNKRLKAVELTKQYQNSLGAAEHRALVGLRTENARLYVEKTHTACALLWDAAINVDSIACALCGPVRYAKTQWTQWASAIATIAKRLMTYKTMPTTPTLVWMTLRTKSKNESPSRTSILADRHRKKSYGVG